MANPRKFSEKIALHHQKQAEETAAFEQIMREVSDATQRVNSSKVARVKPPPEPNDNVETSLRPAQQGLGTFRSGSLPNVAAPQASANEQETIKPEELPLSNQYAMAGGRSGGTSPSRSPAGQRGRASSSVGPMRRPADRRHDTSPYGSTVYLSPPPDSNWRRTNSDSALHQSCGVEQQTTAQPLSPHRTMHSHAHPHLHPHQNHHRRGDIHLDVLAPMNPANRPRSSCEIPRIPNNNNTYDCFDSVYAGGEGGGGLGGEMAVPGGSLPDLTSVHFPPPHYAPHSQHAPHAHPAHRASPDYQPRYNMSPLDHGWIPSGYQTHCSPPSQYSSTSNINIPSPTMVHSPGSPVESPQTDYNNLHQALLQPFEQITMDWAQLVQSLVESGWTAHVQVAENLDNPVSSYNTTYLNHGSPHSPQTTNSSLSYPQSTATSCGSGSGAMGCARHGSRDPVAGGGGFAALQPLASPSAPPTPATPASIPDIVLTDYSGELDAGMFGGEEAQLRAGLDLDDLNLLDDPTALVPDSAVEHEFRLDRL
ncbi:CREB-regulated transcription coactivator 2 isoform X7 [Helicoverpa armigera]|uniref:CREB-regulated transcription coactivator 2 isoform X7 n=1 Tax=Helicoverpa armigera TaxID=29058 RepID=UPI002111EF03|nr:CREB-regulated transcription coactivator 2 isoform X7 [Helicoverpa armigera]